MSNDAIHVVCPHCDSVNRIPRLRVSEQPNCGRCHKGLFLGQVIELRDNQFSQHIDRNDLPVVVDFWAPWCGPCKAMGPAFNEAARSLEPRVRLAKLNTETQQATASRYGIRSIPTMIVFRQGREVARQAGAMSAVDIVRWVNGQI